MMTHQLHVVGVVIWTLVVMCTFCLSVTVMLRERAFLQVKLDIDCVRPGGRGSVAKLHLCPLCSYKTSNYAHLMDHMRAHTGEKPFSCPQCPYRSAQKTNLKTHMRTHTGEKPYLCSHCSYRSTTKSALNRHLYTHK